MPKTTFRGLYELVESRTHYNEPLAYWENETIKLPDINCGPLQRIADACELMAKNHQALIAERDRYKAWYEDKRAEVTARDRTIAAFRGHITKLKKRLEGPDV